ncbi:MAG: phenylalanine--tRNA ligase subunit beta [Bacteroidetes bacterium]|nr:phenylalanine--tRNA ligase subunit beta [Bacteroidota bacterium]
MKVSYNHLKTLIAFDHSPEDLGVILTSTGLEVEGIEKVNAVKGGLDGLVIGTVVECAKHPDADKLSVTRVDAGTGDLLDIVCGAPNVAAGQKVVVATVGATLYPSDGESFIIKKSKIRGTVSEGMLCAEDEIGLGHSHAGIMVLDTELPNGTHAAKYFNLEADYEIEIGLTPNRADAASHLGVARDIKAALGGDLTLPSVEDFKAGNSFNKINLNVKDSSACPRFCALEISGVKVSDSPQWLKSFLNTIGVNSINNIVDISNYICHYLGQPMHIYDADLIKGSEILVKRAGENAKIITLDGVERKLNASDLIISDGEGPVGIAGVFGGNRTGVSENTSNLFLEVAYFNPDVVRKSATSHSLKTDASFRYERGTDPNMPAYAIRLAAKLILEIAGGAISSNLIDFYPEPIKNFDILLKKKNIDRLIGKSLENDLIESILNSLDINILSKNETEIRVSVPPYRVDVTREADVVEEILRIYGFDNVELSEHLSSDFISDFPEKDTENLRVNLSMSLAAAGFNEIQSLSIVRPAENVGSHAEEEIVKLLNPLSEELSQMRSTLIFSGLNALVYNINRRNRDLRFFEFGRTYLKVAQEGVSKIKEKSVLGIWITGNSQSETWSQKSRQVAFNDIYQVIHQVFDAMKVYKTESAETSDPRFEYGLEISTRSKLLCTVGKVSAQIKKTADIKQNVYYAEFDWDLLQKVYSADFQFTEIPKFPEVRRDLSLVINDEISFDQIRKTALNTEKKILKQVNVFDVYKGDKLDAGQKSYSVSFILQDTEKTLNDQQIDKTMQRLMLAFEKENGAIIRK